MQGRAVYNNKDGGESFFHVQWICRLNKNQGLRLNARAGISEIVFSNPESFVIKISQMPISK